MGERSLLVRKAEDHDQAGIFCVHTAAFSSSQEAELVEALAQTGDAVLSIVAIADSSLVGHVLFSQLKTSPAVNATALAPIAILPRLQERGIGSALIEFGIDECKQLGVDLIVVLGDPGYYQRFGFSSELGRRLDAPWSGDELMALELEEGVLSDHPMAIAYPAPFQELEQAPAKPCLHRNQSGMI